MEVMYLTSFRRKKFTPFTSVGNEKEKAKCLPVEFI